MGTLNSKSIDIAVVGASMAGKSTFIASLFSAEVNVDLCNICLIS